MQFIDKNICILGLGIEAVDLINYLVKHTKNCQFAILDQKTKKDFKKTINSLPKSFNPSFRLGKNYLKKPLDKFDIIFRSPGIHRLNKILLKAESKGVEISSSTKLFFKLCPSKIIGVTGTKGKGTTTTLIKNILKASGKSAYMAGNIGIPPFQLLSKLKSTDWLCLELSSFQLQDLSISPHISVVLNITSEHLDVHQDTKEYRLSKQSILKYQSKNDFSVINADYSTTKKLDSITKSQVYWFSKNKKVSGSFVQDNQIYLNIDNQLKLVGPTNKLKLRGAHNWENITAAITASFLASANLSAIKKSVYSFKGLEHRLELIGSLNKVNYYNDSFSTTPETAIAALKSFIEPTTIILGGSDKGSDFTSLGKQIIKTKNLKTIILIGEMTNQILKSLKKAGKFNGQIIKGLKTMKEILSHAYRLTPAGGVVLLSPACASFDMFNNYKHRGEAFKTSFKNLKILHDKKTST